MWNSLVSFLRFRGEEPYSVKQAENQVEAVRKDDRFANRTGDKN